MEMNDAKKWVCILSIVIVVSFVLFPVRRAFFNSYEYTLQKIDDATLYETKKTVEDTCRAMQASYESDRLTYEQYNGKGGERQD